MERIVIDEQRFLDDFRALAAIGATPDGLNREAGSPAYLEARAFLRGRMEAAGLRTHVDAAGNLFGARDGRSQKQRKILSGSHLDSVTNGGPYDGPLGILSALEAVRSLREAGYDNRRTLVVAAFNAEEGGPLGGTFGSRVFAGLLRRQDVSDETLAAYGMRFDALAAAKGDTETYDASVEVHIEQGPVLWKDGLEIGIPTGIVGIARYQVRIRGEANHAGTTPMRERKDALRAAARLLERWFAYAGERDDFVCNVGTMRVLPGHVSIVPEEVVFPLEIRALEGERMREAFRTFERFAAEEGACAVETTQTIEKAPVRLAEAVVEAVAAACAENGFRARRMPSGASHDSAPLAHVMPAGMIFVPSVRGISHSKEECTPAEDMLRGVRCLADTLRRLDAA